MLASFDIGVLVRFWNGIVRLALTLFGWLSDSLQLYSCASIVLRLESELPHRECDVPIIW